MFQIVKEIWRKCSSYLNEEDETFVQEINVNFESEEMSEEILRNLRTRFPSKIFSAGDPFETCAICFSDFQVGEMYRKLNCPHAYHTDCIDDWLPKKRSCPLCKKKVPLCNLDNSIELPPSNASDTTPLLASTNDPSSSVQNGRRSNFSRYRNNSLPDFDRFRSHLAEILGSVNSVQGNDSGEQEGTQTLVV